MLLTVMRFELKFPGDLLYQSPDQQKYTTYSGY